MASDSDLEFVAEVLRDLSDNKNELQDFAVRCKLLADECECEAKYADSDGFTQFYQAAANDWRTLAKKLNTYAARTMNGSGSR